ncbi:hypothetical protein BH11PAT1_BH11PAT1_7680 [soil metagenome]
MKDRESSRRFAVTGIDGAGKNTIIEQVVKELSPKYSIVKPNVPAYSLKDGHEQQHYTGLLHFLDLMYEYGDRTRNPRLIGAVNSLFVMANSRLVEPGMVRNVRPDLVIGERDFHLDPAVYALVYSPLLANKPMQERIKFLQKVTGAHQRTAIFFLTVPADEAVRRIKGRIAGEKVSAEGVRRTKWRHMHENGPTLQRLQREYYPAITALQQISPVDIVEIDTAELSPEGVAELVASKIDSYATFKTNSSNRWDVFPNPDKVRHLPVRSPLTG